MVSNPEFLREGTAVGDSLNPDRIVVGADDSQARLRARIDALDGWVKSTARSRGWWRLTTTLFWWLAMGRLTILA